MVGLQNLGRPTCKQNYNIKLDPEEIGPHFGLVCLSIREVTSSAVYVQIYVPLVQLLLT